MIKEINVVQANDKSFIVRVIEENGNHDITTSQDFNTLVKRLDVVFNTPAITAGKEALTSTLN